MLHIGGCRIASWAVMLRCAHWLFHAVSCLSQLHIFGVWNLRPSRGVEPGDQPNLPSDAHPGSAAPQTGEDAAPHQFCSAVFGMAGHTVVLGDYHQIGRMHVLSWPCTCMMLGEEQAHFTCVAML